MRYIQQLVASQAADVSHLQKIDKTIAALNPDTKLPETTLQADLFLNPASSNLDKDLLKKILAQAETLFSLAHARKQRDLESFKVQFSSRYESQLVPLAIALDTDLGVSYAGVRDEASAGTPLIDELPIAMMDGEQSIDTSMLCSFALKKYEGWQKEKLSAINITESDIEQFKKSTKDLRFPDSMHLMGSLLKQNGRLDEQHFLFDLSGIGGPSAGNLLGRFAYGDERILSLTRELLAAEEAQNPDVIFAEIAHLPQARTGNILLRPVLRKWEIPYVGLSGAPEEAQIKLDDLWVKVEKDEVILWSKAHSKRVLPRLTTAHNYSYQSLPVYKFLCDLQLQGLAMPAMWDWGILESMKHLPRVVYKNIILRKARWTIAEKDLKDLPKEPETAHEVISKWRADSGLPDRVVYVEGDNELLIDFTEPVGRELFLHYLKKYKYIRLEEFLFTEENAVVHNEQGEPFTNEIIIPITRPAARKAAPVDPVPEYKTKRTFLPGSEWVYYKIYSGTKMAESILKSNILPFTEKSLEQGLCQHFFFLRYKDESSHIRLRLYAPDSAARGHLQEAFFQEMEPLQEQGIIHKVISDTYIRELERYGGDCIAMAEQLFYNDSIAVLRFINLLDGAEAERYRMLFALRGIDTLLDDFELTLGAKQALLSGIQKSFFQEFGGQPALQKTLNEKYRQYQKDIFLHMDSSKDTINEVEDAAAVFQIRSGMNRPVIASLKMKAPDEQWMGWLPSYIHMFMNRLFIAQQRKYELAIYHFLEKYYSSQLAIQRKKADDSRYMPA